MTWNGQFHLIHNFSNLFPPKLLRMTQNGQFCMAKIKCTVIQGNFYERLPFYMDSCALSPMASLLYVEVATPRAMSMDKLCRGTWLTSASPLWPSWTNLSPHGGRTPYEPYEATWGSIKRGLQTTVPLSVDLAIGGCASNNSLFTVVPLS